MQAAQKQTVEAPASTELVVVQGLQPIQIFTQDKVQELLSEVKKIKDGYVAPDLSTKEGQDELKSFAFRFVKTKTLLDGIGKDYVAHLKEEPKRIDALRKTIRDTLDAWAEEVRAPVTEIETKEAARIEEHKGKLDAVRNLTVFSTAGKLPAPQDVQFRIDRLVEYKARSWEEFAPIVEPVMAKVEKDLASLLVEARQYAEEQAELEKLRKEKAERDERDRLEKIKLEGIEEGKRLAAQEKAPETLSQVLDALPPAQPVADPAATIPTSRLDVQKEHRARVNKEAWESVLAIFPMGLTPTGEETAKAIFKAIVAGQVKNVTVVY